MKKRAATMFRLRKPPKPKGKRFLYAPLEERTPDDLCGGRRLIGDEFKQRAAELEARDNAELRRRKAYGL